MQMSRGMNYPWIDRLGACTAVDHYKKPTIKCVLIGHMLQGADPNAVFDGDEQEVKQILEYLYLRGKGQSGMLDAPHLYFVGIQAQHGQDCSGIHSICQTFCSGLQLAYWPASVWLQSSHCPWCQPEGSDTTVTTM